MPYQQERIREFVEWISKWERRTGGRFGWFNSELYGLAVMLAVIEETEGQRVKFIKMEFHTYVLPFISNRTALWDLEVWLEGQEPAGHPRYRDYSTQEFLEYATPNQKQLYEEYLWKWNRSRIYEECNCSCFCMLLWGPVTEFLSGLGKM